MLNAVLEQPQAVRFLDRVREGALTSPLLLVGPEGTGRKFAVRNLTQEMFCTGTRTEGCPCFDCLQIKQGVHPDYLELGAGEKDIGVDAIREIIEGAMSSPSMAPCRVFLIDGADRMTTAAANALLKTLEEPPRATRFFLLAESPSGVIPTIRSRCGLVVFHPLPEPYVLSKLQQFEPDATKALVYVRMGEGSLGRAIQLWGSGRLTLRDKALNLLRFAKGRDVASVFSLVDSVEKDLPLLLRFTDHLLHDILMLNVAPDKLINLDAMESLRALKVGVADSMWQAVRTEIREARQTYQRVKINLAFHVKAILIQTFSS